MAAAVVAAAAIDPRRRSSSISKSKPVATAVPAPSSPRAVSSVVSRSVALSCTPLLGVISSGGDHHQSQSNKCNASTNANTNASSNGNNNSNNSSHSHHGKKKTGIPVGIAVARQRNNKDSQISPKSVVLVTAADSHNPLSGMNGSIGSHNNNSNNISSSLVLQQQQQQALHHHVNGTNGAKTMLMSEKMSGKLVNPIISGSTKMTAADAASYQSVIARDSISGKLLVLIPTSSSSPTALCRSTTPIKLSSSSEAAEGRTEAAAAAIRPTAEGKALTITTGDEEEIAAANKHKLTLTSSPHVREEDLLLKKVHHHAVAHRGDETLDLKKRSAPRAVCKPTTTTTKETESISVKSEVAKGTRADSHASSSTSAIASGGLTAGCNNNKSSSTSSSSNNNALVVEQNQSVLNFINARGLDLLVDLVEQQQPDNFCQTITRHVPLSASGVPSAMTQTSSDSFAKSGFLSSSFPEMKASKEESNLDLLSMLCEQRCRDEEWKRQQAVRESNKRRLSYPSCGLQDQSQQEPVVSDVFTRLNGSSFQQESVADSDRESCVPLKKRARRFSSLDPSRMTDAAASDDWQAEATTTTTAAEMQQRTVPSITIQTSPKNSSGHPGLVIKIKNKESDEASSSSCPTVTAKRSQGIKVLLKQNKQQQQQEQQKSTKMETNKRCMSGSGKHSVASDRKVRSRKQQELGKGFKVSVDQKESKKQKHDNKKNKETDDSSSHSESISSSSLCTSSRIIPVIEKIVDPYDFTSAPEFDSSAVSPDPPLVPSKRHKKKHKKEKKEKRKHRTSVEQETADSTTAEEAISQGCKNRKETSVGTSGSKTVKSRKSSPKKTSTNTPRMQSSGIPDPLIIASKKDASSHIKCKASVPPASSSSKPSLVQQSNSKSTRSVSRRSGQQTGNGSETAAESGNTGTDHHNNSSSTNSHNNNASSSSNDWFAIRRSERIFFAHEFGSSFTLRDKRDSDDEEGESESESHDDEGVDPKKTKRTVKGRGAGSDETKDEKKGEDKCTVANVAAAGSRGRAGEVLVVGGEKRKRDHDHKSKHHKHHHKKHKRHKRKHASDDEEMMTESGKNKETGSCSSRHDASSSGKELSPTNAMPVAALSAASETEDDKSLSGAGRYTASSTGISIRFAQLRRSLDESSEATTMESNPGIFCWEFQGSPIKKSYQSTTKSKKSRTTIRKDFFNAVKRTRVGCSPVRRISSESSLLAESLEELDDDHEMILKVGECAIFCSSSPSATPPLQSEYNSPSCNAANADPLTESRPRLPFIGRIDSFWRETSKTQTGSLVSPGSTSTTEGPAVATPAAPAAVASAAITSSPEKGEYNLRKGSPNKKQQQLAKAVRVLEPQAINCIPIVIEEEEKMMVKVRWFYHPQEAVSKNKKTDPMKVLCDPDGGLFESFTHSDENDVQTIASKCLVMAYEEFAKHQQKERGCSTDSGVRRVYFLAGRYEPLMKEVTFEPDVPLNSMP